jgi:hypothetical protein
VGFAALRDKATPVEVHQQPCVIMTSLMQVDVIMTPSILDANATNKPL